MNNDKFVELDQAFFEESWEWLELTHPGLAHKVATAIERGSTPSQIRGRILELGGANRIGIATRCENAAKYLISQKQSA